MSEEQNKDNNVELTADEVDEKRQEAVAENQEATTATNVDEDDETDAVPYEGDPDTDVARTNEEGQQDDEDNSDA